MSLFVLFREFAAFSEKLGVQNYREYEEQHLKKARHARKQRRELETQISHLRAQLDYENSRDLQKPIDNVMASRQRDQNLLDQLYKESCALEKEQQRVCLSQSMM